MKTNRRATSRAILALGLAASLAGPDAVAARPARGDERPALLVDAEGRALEPLLLRLRDGGILFGGIEGHDEATLVFRRLDNGGRVALPWSLLDAGQERELRLRFGYVEVEAEELYVKAHKIPLVDGTELVGLIVSSSGGVVYVKTATQLVPLGAERVAGPPILVQVPADDIYTREELYQQKLAELSIELQGEKPVAAGAHLEVARHCERILDYAHAVVHYAKASELDRSKIPPEVERAAVRAAEKAAVQEQVDLLAQADTWRARRQYPRALAGHAEFLARFPKSPLLDDAAKLRARIEKSQERDLREEVVKRFHFWLARLSLECARDPLTTVLPPRKRTYEETVEYVEEALAQAIVERIVVDLASIDASADEDRVRAYFAERKGGKVYKASYGTATWLLGPDEAREGLEEPAPVVLDTKPVDEKVKKLEEKIERYVKNQQIQARKKKTLGATEPEDAWTQLSTAAKAQFVRAYFVEHTDALAGAPGIGVTGVRFSNCRTCGGTGALEVVNSGAAGNNGQNQAGARLQTCPTCQAVGVVRRVSYR